MKERVDILMVEQGLVESRARAQAEIQAGNVLANGLAVRKPGQRFESDCTLTLRSPALKWVSRAALKLEHALDEFDLDMSGAVVLDLGASTGGFSQVVLFRGGAHVFAVDVGHGQLHESLSGDPRLTLMEGQNARDLSQVQFDRPITFVVSDLSFISLKLGLPPAMILCEPGSILVALIKPQFEVGKGNLGKGGIVRDELLQNEVAQDISRWIDDMADWRVLGIVESPITGSDGNKEFLIAAEKSTH